MWQSPMCACTLYMAVLCNCNIIIINVESFLDMYKHEWRPFSHWEWTAWTYMLRTKIINNHMTIIRTQHYCNTIIVISIWVYACVSTKVGVAGGGGVYLNAIKMSMIMQTAITPPRINESLLFLKLIFWTRLLISGNRANSYKSAQLRITETTMLAKN